MPVRPPLLAFLIGLTALVAVHCDGGSDQTRTAPLLAGPPETMRPGSAVGTPSPLPVPLPANPAAMTNMPNLSCGGLLGTSTCDPVTAWPCNTTEGETCDYSNSAGAFRCYLLPTAAPFCGACDRMTEFCGVGTTCVAERCERYCCGDGDCGRGRCVPGLLEPELAASGYCEELGVAECGPNPALTPPETPVSSDAGPSDAGSRDAATD